ncbi:MAG: cyclic nucleotide-binding domain-containing protein [Magnetococcus sp. YQC-5]
MREITDLDTHDLLMIIQQTAFFTSFSAAEQKLLAGDYTHVVAYDVGEYLIQEGSTKEKSLFLLLSGGASVVKEGASIPLATLYPGDIFGEVSFLTSRMRTSNVIVHPIHTVPTHPPGPIMPDFGALELPVAMREATATALRFDKELMTHMDLPFRIQFKDQIIEHLTCRVELMHEKVVTATGRDPLLTVDPELEEQLREKAHSLPELERTKDRLIEQLAEFLDELNHCLVAC